MPRSCSALYEHVPMSACPHGAAVGPTPGLHAHALLSNMGAPVCGLLRRPALQQTARWGSSRELPTAAGPPHGCRKLASVRVPRRPTPLCL